MKKHGKPGYKMTPLGWLPMKWKIQEFSEFVKKTDCKFDPAKNDITMKCIELEHISQVTGRVLAYVNSDEQKSIKNIFKKNDVLFGKLRPYLRKYWLAEFDGVCSSEIWVLRGIDNVCINEYLFLMVQTHDFIQAANVTSGSKMPRADWDYVSAFPFPLPPLPEQKAIAKVLSTWDKAIEKTQELIKQKELRKKYLMQQLLTGKKRLKGFSGEWKRVKISQIAHEVSIKNKDNNNFTVLSCTKYNGLVPSLEYFGRKIFADDLTTYKIVPKYHFAYATNHIEEGSIGYQDQLEFGLTSPMYTVFKTNGEINDAFLFRILKTHNYILEYQKRMEGSIDRRGGLRWDEFSKIKITIPSIEEQNAITNILQKHDIGLVLLNKHLESFQLQKKGMMQVLLTGKKRIKKEGL